MFSPHPSTKWNYGWMFPLPFTLETIYCLLLHFCGSGKVSFHRCYQRLIYELKEFRRMCHILKYFVNLNIRKLILCSMDPQQNDYESSNKKKIKTKYEPFKLLVTVPLDFALMNYLVPTLYNIL